MPSFHSLSLKQVLAQLGADAIRGLGPEQVSSLLAEFGPNELVAAPKKTALEMFLDEFRDFVVAILVVAAVVSGFLGEWVDAAAIIAIVVLNALLGFIQEYRAEKAIEALKKLVAPQARVVRGGVEMRVSASQLVPGDVVMLEAGDTVPADARLIESMRLEAAEASLTGESTPVEKDAEAVVGEKTALAERKNSVFMGTVIVHGLGRAVVTATGMQTEFGKIATQVQAVQDEQTPLQKKLDAVGKRLGQAAIAIVAVVFVTGVLRNFPPLEMFLTAVTLAVAAVPEGLPAIMTIALAIGVQRMAKRNAIIRKLKAVETLGSANVIATDKTGTLTRNEMTVRKAFFAGQEVDVSGSGYGLKGGFTLAGNGKAFDARGEGFKLFLRAGALCTSAQLSESKSGVTVLGDPTEGALLVFSAKAGVRKEAESRAYARVFELPFDAERKMMSTIHKRTSSKHYAFVKGAPEMVLAECDRIMGAGGERTLTPADRRMLLSKNEEFAGKALRVLAIAYREVPASRKYSEKDVERKLVFLGLVGMIDPPREEVKEALALCNTAGIRVIMVTGDNPMTAQAIARELGMRLRGARALTGIELDSLGAKEFDRAVASANVFARVSPEHKLRIVESLQKQGFVVAMTGDGVNDAPALKKADIGVAMGITGTDVTKEASDMVLADDNFASIVNAVREGRIIYSNIVKSIFYLLTCNVGEILAIFLATLISWPVPLLPIQILWMNLVTDGLPALALAMDPEEPGVMNKPPRKKSEEILGMRNAAYLIGIGAVIGLGTLALYYFELLDGSGLEKARTMAFSTIICFQLFHSLNSRSRTESLLTIGAFKNRFLWAAALLALGLQVAITQTSVLDDVFKTEALSLSDWLLILAVSSTVFWLYEAWKLLKRRYGW